jgi:hypothetical protein
MKCPGYCCSYPVIEVKDRDAARIAKHFDMPLAKAEKKFSESPRLQAHHAPKKDEIYGRSASSSTPRSAAAPSMRPAPPPAVYSPAKAIVATMTS